MGFFSIFFAYEIKKPARIAYITAKTNIGKQTYVIILVNILWLKLTKLFLYLTNG